jgi:hypothetical protein
VRKLIVLALGGLVGLAVAKNLPDLRRYLRMRRM